VEDGWYKYIIIQRYYLNYMIRTRVTELLGIDYPILQGALSGLGTWEFAAAVSQTGALGCFTAAVARTPDRLKKQIRLLRNKVGEKPFSVNISLYMCPHQEEMFKVLIDEEVPIIETSVYAIPDEWVYSMKDKGIKWLHKVTILKHALHAEKQGADAIIVIGLEGFGFKHVQQLPTMTSITWMRRHLKVPIIAGGGIGDPSTFLSTLCLGADAAYIGSAFLLTKEAPIPENMKRKMLNIRPDDPTLIYRILAPPSRDDFLEVMSLRGKIPMERWVAMMERVLLKDPEWRDAKPVWEEKFIDVTKYVSFAASYPDRIMSVKEFIEWLVNGSRQILRELEYSFERG
jgi:nitronate monooxygenase